MQGFIRHLLCAGIVTMLLVQVVWSQSAPAEDENIPYLVTFGGNSETEPDFRMDNDVPQVTVLTPAGGATVTGEDPFDVTWIVTEEGGSSLITDPITLYYTTDEGQNWSLMAENEANDGSYTWNVPLVNSTVCIVSVEAEDEAGSIGRDVSGIFEIISDGWIRGTITLSGESDHSGAVVEISQDRNFVEMVTTESDGSYEIRLLRGTYSVEAWAKGFYHDYHDSAVEVSKNSTEEINFDLPLGWVDHMQDRMRSADSPEKVLTPPFDLVTSFETGHQIQAPIIYSNRIAYVPSMDNKLYAVNVDTESLEWSYTFPYDARTVTISDGRIYACDYNGYLVVLDESDGGLLWSFVDGGYWTHYKGGSVAYGKYFFARGYKLYSIDAYDGSVIWSYHTPTTTNYNSSPVAYNGIIYVGSEDGILHAVNESDGSLEWSYTTGGAVQGGPLIYNGRIYFGSHDNNFYAINLSDQSLAWSYTSIDDFAYDPAAADGVIYAGSKDNKLYAFDADDGTIHWSFTSPVNASMCPPAVANGVVYAGQWEFPMSSEHGMLALDVSDGSLLWSFNAGSSNYGPPTVCDEFLMFGSYDSYLYIFENDETPPSVPTLEATALPNSDPTYVSLSWSESSDGYGSGVKGYNLYRSGTHGSGYSLVNGDSLITGTSTTDSDVSYGNNYYYVVTAVDYVTNESDYSNESSAPNLNISKEMTVESPVSGGYTGGYFDAVPGATITYLITYLNNGFAPATSVEVIDKVPDHTEYKIDSASGEAVTEITYSDDNGGTFNYTPSGTHVDPNVTNIKWGTEDLGVTLNSTVEFKVIIK